MDTSGISTGPRWLNAYLALRASRPEFWLTLALAAEILGIVSGAAQFSAGGAIGAALLSIVLLWPIRRGVLFAWHLFLFLHWVQLALIAVFALLVAILPTGDFSVDSVGVVATALALWAVSAKCVRPVPRQA
ncbi:hypothetical protein GCM10022381_36250 [Leifsonia kafniensis]|uniref:Uncharacterized protein n=1 Tax=Leifsonia kafniensis TaxID=475957 RepID=A0ABP7KZL5_9MICO